MKQSSAAPSRETLAQALTIALITEFTGEEFSRSAVYEWVNEDDIGQALVVQRYPSSDALVVTYGSESDSKFFIEFWIRTKAPSLEAPTVQEKDLAKTPIRTNAPAGNLHWTVKHIVDIVRHFHETSVEEHSNVFHMSQYRGTSRKSTT